MTRGLRAGANLRAQRAAQCFSQLKLSIIMFRKVITIILAFTAAGLRAETFTIEGAVARAIKSNPDLAAARWSIEEARGRLIQSGRLPNPAVETELKPNVRGREFSFSAGFMQKIPVTRRLHLERAISEAHLAQAEAEVLNAGRLISAQVRMTAVKLLALQEQKALKEKQRTNSLNLAEEAERNAKKAEGSSLEAAQFGLEAQQLSLDLLQADAERTALAGELRPLLGLGAAGSVEITGELSAPSAPAGAVSPERRADYRAAQAKESAARTGIDLARAGKWDDASYGLTAEFARAEDAPSGLENDGFIGFKFSIPLPFWNKNEGKIHEANAAAAKAEQEKQALALRIRAEAAAAQQEMAAAANIIAQTSGPLLKQALALEEKFVKAKAEGQATLTDVLRSREKRFALEAARLHALRDWHLARARLLSAQGR